MPISKDHYISIKGGMFDSTKKEDIDRMFSTLAAHPNRDTIVVYLHGGLNSEQQAMQTAEQTLAPRYLQAGGYPVFFFWQTGIKDVVTSNLGDIFNEKVFERLLNRVVQFVIAKLMQTDDTRGELLELDSIFVVQDELEKPFGSEPYKHWHSEHMPEDAELTDLEKKQFKNELEADSIFVAEAQAIANGLRSKEEIENDALERTGGVKASTYTLMSPTVLEDIREEATDGDTRGVITTARIIKGAVSVLARVIQRFASRRDHGVFVTTVEEILYEFYLANIGQLGWKLMKGNGADAFHQDANKFGGSAFLKALKTYWDSGNRPRVVLVGHSAGTIFICHFLQAASDIVPPELKFDVVFLAPACTFDLFSNTLEKAGDRINDIRLFGMHDEKEQQDRMLGLAYPRSILYFVSGVLEDEKDKPLVGMHRYFNPNPPFDPTSYPQIEIARAYFKQSDARTVWANTDDGPGRRTTADTHEKFDDVDIPTIESVQHIISQGFSDVSG